ncbi:sphingomyelinase family protein [Aulographum hederae CBS 113979]|uniref:Sphingomyelinase family protein n=1 Tax=Aulographum hederae CBS 113979 TaxID=1176131 RepID=A0A6G1GRL2_9PEZI|nr:sphingomyelinase family protein [Aulographum hederae CBS 113979]
MADSPDRLRVLTLNCWGLKFLSDDHGPRLTHIGSLIANSPDPPQIVCLQECWTAADYDSIRTQTLSILPHGKFYHSGIFGGGLAILSKWPIEESSMVRYPLNGRPTAFFRGDWFVGKGVAHARILLPKGDTMDREFIEVFCTHLHAPYEKEPHDSYICHRTAQAWEIAKLMKGALLRGSLVVAAGDFNMLPDSLAHKLISTHGHAQDVWKVLHPDSSVGAWEDEVERRRGKPCPTAEYNIKHNGITCDSVLNTWRWGKQVRKRLRKEDIKGDMHAEDPRGKRLDYIFYSHMDRGEGSWAVEDAEVGMLGRHPELRCSLSDHFSVEATFTRTTAQNGQAQPHTPNSASNPVPRLPDPTHSSHLTFLPLTTYTEILHMISLYTAREHSQRRLRLSHLCLQLCISIGCLIAIWWSPHAYVSFILMLVSTFGLAAGVVDGLIGGLFVGSEERALREFEWEIGNARAWAGACGGERGGERGRRVVDDEVHVRHGA